MYCSQCGYNNPVTVKFCKNCDMDLQGGSIDSVRPGDSAHPANSTIVIYAGFWARFLAAFLDILVIGACVILLIFAIAALIAYNGRESLLYDRLALPLFYGVIIFISVSYYILMESGDGCATLGKRWMNTKVLDTKGNQLTITRALARMIFRVLSFALPMIVFLIQPFTRRKQTLHDLLSRTVVLRANESHKISIMATLLVLFMALMVPVLAVFSTAGLPVFQQRIQKVQMNHGLQLGKEATLAVAQFYRNNGRVPAVIGDTGVKISTSAHVAGVEVNPQNGEITVVFSDTVRRNIRNKHLIFTPMQAADQSISWKCRSTDIEMQYLADICK